MKLVGYLTFLLCIILRFCQYIDYDRMTDEWTGKDLEGRGHGVIEVLSWCFPANHNPDSWFPGQDSNQEPSKYKPRVLQLCQFTQRVKNCDRNGKTIKSIELCVVLHAWHTGKFESKDTDEPSTLCWSFTYHKPITAAWCTCINTDTAQEISSMLIIQYRISVNRWNLERYYRNGSSPWFCVIKMNPRAFVTINCMTAGHSSLHFDTLHFDLSQKAEKRCRLPMWRRDRIPPPWPCES
jgi:hypothetical protein